MGWRGAGTSWHIPTGVITGDNGIEWRDKGQSGCSSTQVQWETDVDGKQVRLRSHIVPARVLPLSCWNIHLPPGKSMVPTHIAWFLIPDIVAILLFTLITVYSINVLFWHRKPNVRSFTPPDTVRLMVLGYIVGAAANSVKWTVSNVFRAHVAILFMVAWWFLMLCCLKAQRLLWFPPLAVTRWDFPGVTVDSGKTSVICHFKCRNIIFELKWQFLHSISCKASNHNL